MFFCFGIGSQRLALPRREHGPLPILGAAGHLAFWAAGTFFAFSGAIENFIDVRGTFDLLNRVSVALLLWLIAGMIVRSSAFELFRRLEKKIYLIFLSHVAVLSAAGGIFKAAFDGYSTPAYLVLLLAAPLLSILAVEVIWPVVARLPAVLQLIIMGKAVRQHTPLAIPSVRVHGQRA